MGVETVLFQTKRSELKYWTTSIDTTTTIRPTTYTTTINYLSTFLCCNSFQSNLVSFSSEQWKFSLALSAATSE